MQDKNFELMYFNLEHNDDALSYFEDEGESVSEKEEIKGMIINCLLNISLCDLKLEKFDEVRRKTGWIRR